jgi:hypothetical protein
MVGKSKAGTWVKTASALTDQNPETTGILIYSKTPEYRPRLMTGYTGFEGSFLDQSDLMSVNGMTWIPYRLYRLNSKSTTFFTSVFMEI